MQLSDLSASSKAGLTCMLLVALAVFLLGEALLMRTYRTVDGSPGLSITDLERHFTSDSRSLFEARIRTDMREHVDEADLGTLITWARSGADRADYDKRISGILERRCVQCHDTDGMAGFRPLATYEQVIATVEEPPTPPFSWMVTTTKIHLLGISVLLLVPSLMAAGGRLPVAAQAGLVWCGFAGLLGDFGFWWLMRWDLRFAIGRGVTHLMFVVAFLALTAAALHGLWFGRRTRTS